MLTKTLIAALLAASFAVWYWVFLRWQAGQPAIPLARRRPVPWQGQDVLFVFLMAILFPLLGSVAVHAITGGGPAQQAGRAAVGNEAAKETTEKEVTDQDLQTAHPAAQLLLTGDWRMIAVATIMAVVVAPVFEEFLFRVLLQGWLEAVWSRRRRSHRELRQAPNSWIPVVLPAALFALMHLRTGHAPPASQYVTAQFLAQMAADLLTLGLAIFLLRYSLGATCADLGWQPRKLPTDAKLAFGALVAVTPLILLLQEGLTFAVKRAGISLAPDPIPLFFLALVFGLLYRRTHRITPSLMLHMAFNATSIAGLFLGV